MTVPAVFDERFAAPRLSFELLNEQPTAAQIAARTGTLSFTDAQTGAVRSTVSTPAIIGYTRKGAMPHVTPDNMARLPTEMVHVSLEHLLETTPPPFVDAPFSLLRFISLHNAHRLRNKAQTVTTMSLQDPSALDKAKLGTDDSLACKTPRGAFQVAPSAFAAWSLARPPDILLAMADETVPDEKSKKRLQKSVVRSVDWLQHILRHAQGRTNVFAPLVGGGSVMHRRAHAQALLGRESRQLYLPSPTNSDEPPLDALVAGYSLALPLERGLDVADLFQASLSLLDPRKPRLVPAVRGPHDILRLVTRVGIDLIIDEWSSSAATCGVALDFDFPITHPNGDTTTKKSIGLNLFDEQYARDFTPLSSSSSLAEGAQDMFGAASASASAGAGVPTKGYLHHLLQSHEMTALVVLAMHNANVMQRFMRAVRRSIAHGTIEADARAFEETYEDAEGEPFAWGREYACVMAAKEGSEKVEKQRGKGSLKQPDKPVARSATTTPTSTALDAEVAVVEGEEVMSSESGSRGPLQSQP